MRLLFKHWGHEVHVSNRGREAIEQAPLLKPHIMFVDLGMPDIDGLTVARQLRQTPALGSTSLIAYTGYSDEERCQQALEAGFDECLVKPLPAEQLRKLLSGVQSRIAASQERTSVALATAAVTRDLNEKSRWGLDVPVVQPTSTAGLAVGAKPISIRVQKSGISDIIVLEDRSLAAQIRQWLRERGCRVGPVFAPSAGQAAFFTYSRRQAQTLLASHPGVRIRA